MKKVYGKPAICFESFSASTSLSSKCEQILGLPAQFVCGIPDENGLGMNIFTVKQGSDCVFPGDDNGIYNGLCYHVPSDANDLFNS